MTPGHNCDITHMHDAKDDRQPFGANLRLIGRRDQRGIVFAERVGGLRLALAVQFFVQINIKLRVAQSADHHPEDQQPLHLEHHFNL